MDLPSATPPILEVRDLSVSLRLTDGRRVLVVDRVSFSLEAGGTLGIVGESGSGKSMTNLAIMGLLPRQARIEGGQVLLEGEDLVKMEERQLRKIRGSKIGMTLQDPMTALDPSFTIRSQVAAPLHRHRGLRGAELDGAVVDALEQVHLSSVGARLRQYPHQLSGGMRQRVVSAIALSGRPRVLIADEPTSALDVTTQARYLRLLRELRESTGVALLLVAHDLMVIRHVCARVAVMYAGQVVEHGFVADIFERPQHPYTRALLAAVPAPGQRRQLESIEGQAPDLTDTVDGCRFASRCRFARDVCRQAPPKLTTRSSGQLARCFGTEPDGWVPR
jgi:oligopeptide/dipeptide ABC transporter ATP-binding protein